MALGEVRSAISAILWAQWRSLQNLRAGETATARRLMTVPIIFWYGLWTLVGWMAAVWLARARSAELGILVSWGLFLVTLYWQMAPVLTASLGASLDLGKLRVYPLPENHLFWAEFLLRLSTGAEMLLVLTGVGIGLLRHPGVRGWVPVAALPLFVCFNAALAAGLRSLLEGWLARPRVREVVALVLVLAAAVPQLFLLTGPRRWFESVRLPEAPIYWPWVSFGRLAADHFGPQDWVLAALWSVAAFLFGRWQFGRALARDPASMEVAPLGSRRRKEAAGPPSAWISRLAPDPLAAIIEKELRSLVRSPRFRLVFLMGFSFGFLIWAPVLYREGKGFSQDYPLVVSIYALLLLAEVIFWNAFGFDRSAAALWFVAPAPFQAVLMGKNLAGMLLVMAETTAVLAVCGLLGARVGGLKIVEVYAVVVVLCLYWFSAGNLFSLYFARPVDPGRSWGRASVGRFQLLLLLLYPVLGAPVAAAYVARMVFGGDAVFYALLGAAALAGAVLYRLSLRQASRIGEARRERLLDALLAGGGPVLTQ